MKKTVRVIKEFEYEIEIADKILNQDFVTAFEYSFWELEAEDLEGKLSKLFEVVGYQLANGEKSFIEGVGECGTKWRKENYPDKEFNVIYSETYEDTETEIVE